MKRAALLLLLWAAPVAAQTPASVGEWLWSHGFRATVWLEPADCPSCPRRLGRGAFRPEVPLELGKASPRYGMEGRVVHGSLTSERCAGQASPNDGTLAGCLLAKMGFPPGYRMTLQDSADLAYVAAGAGNACDHLERALGCTEPAPEPPPASLCGDGTCSSTETSAVCPQDCPVPPPPPPAPPCDSCCACPPDLREELALARQEAEEAGRRVVALEEQARQGESRLNETRDWLEAARAAERALHADVLSCRADTSRLRTEIPLVVPQRVQQAKDRLAALEARLGKRYARELTRELEVLWKWLTEEVDRREPKP